MSNPLQPIFIDVYVDDLKGVPNWTAAAADPQIAGAILKATQGLKYSYPLWFNPNWSAIHAVERNIGTDWFCGAYHYLDATSMNPLKSGDAQAAFFLQNVEAAGGLALTDLWPIVDLESTDNTGATPQQFIETTFAFSAGILSRTGRATMLYGGETLRANNITLQMGCSWLWTASYTPKLSSNEINSMGWSEQALWGWQYQGTAPGCTGQLNGYPTTIPNFAPNPGEVDLSVMVMAGGLPALRAALVGAS
jgi:GH25 family lysozyme M1 (1,4-beta-N-acetylmuramidase)